ncbi:MAG: hypothetical protein ACTSO7_18155 [Candidatus Heimdallarchaeota archaeon]
MPEEDKIDEKILDDILKKKFDKKEFLIMAQRIKDEDVDYEKLHIAVQKRLDKKKSQGGND